MGVKSQIVLKVVCTGVGHQLAAKLIELAKEALPEDSVISVDDIESHLSASTDAVQLSMYAKLEEPLDDLLADWWGDHCIPLTQSDRSACGQYMVFTENELETNLAFGPHGVGLNAGIQVDDFDFDDLEVDSELKGQPGIKAYRAYFEQETSLECNVTIYAKNEAEATDKADEIEAESLVYKDSSRLEQRSVQIVGEID